MNHRPSSRPGLGTSPGLSTPGVIPIHTVCPGRARLAVRGLYRSPVLQRRLEAALARQAGVRAVAANIVTGRLLVRFGAGMTLEQLVLLIAAELAARPAMGTGVDDAVADRRAARAGRAGPRRFAVGEVLGGVGAMLRGLAAGRLGRPAPLSPSGSAPHGRPRHKELQPIRAWFAMDLRVVVADLGASAADGLTLDEVSARLRRYGENALTAAEKRSDIAIFIGQFNNLPVALLGVSAGVSVVTGGLLDAAVILGVVLINSIIGFITERQAERTIDALTHTGAHEVRLLRGGEAVSAPVEQIVPGDILLLAPGDYVAADVRLLRAHRLSVDESALTGESMPVAKDHEFQGKDDTPLGDRRNMAFMGTHVTGGNGRGLVVATAEATELGQIQTMVGEAQAPETPLQRQLGRMGTQLALLSGGVCVGVFGIGVLRGYAWLEMLKASVSLAVAAVPEGLPAVATTTLALGIDDMRRRNVAVRHLDAVETLGSVQVFCMDKTGTLTMNRMAVVALYGGRDRIRVVEHRWTDADGRSLDPLARDDLSRLLQVVALCSETELQGVPGRPAYVGSATENALVELAVEAGIDVPMLRRASPTLKTRHRAEGRPFMSTLHPDRDGRYLLAVKGSPAEVLALCTSMLRDGEETPLSAERRAEILGENERMAGGALRVLAVAYRVLDTAEMPARTGGLVWLGLAGLAEPMPSANSSACPGTGRCRCSNRTGSTRWTRNCWRVWCATPRCSRASARRTSSRSCARCRRRAWWWR